MLMPADEDDGAGGDVHYVTVEQDPDQSPEVCVSACADKGKPQLTFTYVLLLKFLIFSLELLCAFMFRS
jgi:hypothetical protein